MHVDAAADHLRATLQLTALADLVPAISRIRRLFDLDADPEAVAATLRLDERLAPLVDANPGRRAPGAVDAHELAVRAILGQQVSVAAARTLASRITAAWGEPVDGPPGLDRLFPDVTTLSLRSPSDFAMPASRATALIGVCRALAAGDVVLNAGVDRRSARRELLRLPGIGPWTADYLVMRALSDPDVLLSGDLVALQGARALGIADTASDLDRAGQAWAPWRSYATQLLWTAATEARSTAPPRRGTRAASTRAVKRPNPSVPERPPHQDPEELPCHR
jgi:AraC family transcriptional regulator of adaptative response / DNA-3-methyladenine glycosylase II